jgi:hypothetical protein
MRHISTIATLAGLLVIGTQALAADGASRSAISRRQLNDCMTQRMTANKTMSYIEAAKTCNDQIKTQSVKAASNAALVSNAPLTSNASVKAAIAR